MRKRLAAIAWQRDCTDTGTAWQRDCTDLTTRLSVKKKKRVGSPGGSLPAAVPPCKIVAVLSLQAEAASVWG